jgi:hypothetical protein
MSAQNENDKRQRANIELREQLAIAVRAQGTAFENGYRYGLQVAIAVLRKAAGRGASAEVALSELDGLTKKEVSPSNRRGELPA